MRNKPSPLPDMRQQEQSAPVAVYGLLQSQSAITHAPVRQVVDPAEVTVLKDEDQDAFMRAWDATEPTPALVDLMKKARVLSAGTNVGTLPQPHSATSNINDLATDSGGTDIRHTIAALLLGDM